MTIVREIGKPVLFDGLYLVVQPDGSQKFMTAAQHAANDWGSAIAPTTEQLAEINAAFGSLEV